MTFFTDGRPFTFITTTALTVYDAVTVVLWSLLLFLSARRSGVNLSRDLF